MFDSIQKHLRKKKKCVKNKTQKTMVFTWSRYLADSKYIYMLEIKPEDHWSCIAHLSAEDMLKSVVIEEKK